MKTALIILAVIAALLAAVFCYRHFVTDSIMDKGGMEFDWKADMEGHGCAESRILRIAPLRFAADGFIDAGQKRFMTAGIF